MTTSSYWNKIYDYLTEKRNTSIMTLPVTEFNKKEHTQVSRILSKWTNMGLLIRIEGKGKKTIKYRLPINFKRYTFCA